ncbi:MAG: hypothetical protein NVS1B14_06170 [Vulcanimicrobiaceae bacterium]
MKRTLIFRVSLALAVSAALLSFGPPFARAQLPLAGSAIDGIQCQGMEGSVVHIHQHLQLFDRGRAVGVPAMIGIVNAKNCLYWLHTHTNDGLIHNESPIRKVFTLGQFFDIWGMELSWWTAGPVRAVGKNKLVITVNGKRFRGHDPRAIPLHNHDEFVIQSGPPYTRVINKFKWGSLG